MNTQKYPHELSRGFNNVVVAIDETRVKKLFDKTSRASDMGSEAKKQRYANAINGLVAKLIETEHDAIIMERLRIIAYRDQEIEKRVIWFELFERQINELHIGGFVHRDIARPEGFPGGKYDNIVFTKDGLRLIDCGISSLKEEVGEKSFAIYVETENEEIREFKKVFLETEFF